MNFETAVTYDRQRMAIEVVTILREHNLKHTTIYSNCMTELFVIHRHHRTGYHYVTIADMDLFSRMVVGTHKKAILMELAEKANHSLAMPCVC